MVGPDAELFLHFFSSDRAVQHRIEHRDLLIHELHEVLVGGNDRDFRSFVRGKARIGRDQIVRLIAFQLDRRKVEGFRRLANQRELGDEVFRRLRAVCLVVWIDVVAKSDPVRIEDDGDMVGVGVVDQLHQHLGEAKDGADGRSVRTGEGRQRMIGAEYESGTIDQENVLGSLAQSCVLSDLTLRFQDVMARAIGTDDLAPVFHVEKNAGVSRRPTAAVARHDEFVRLNDSSSIFLLFS